jgi:D-3-phosphoglycerate dehydrogenase
LENDLQTVLATNALHSHAAEMLEGKVRLVICPDARFETLRKLAGDAHGIIVRSQLPDDICEHAPLLKGLVRHGVGLDFIPVESATCNGVAVANLPGCNTQTVAEYCFAQLLNLRRPLVKSDALLRAEGWDRARAIANDFGELSGTTLGIIGVGVIGTRIAEIASALGMKVIGSSRRKKVTPVYVEHVSVEEIFLRSDAVILSCALTPETRGLVSERLINSMKASALLINVSRGPVLDTAALVDALMHGRIAGAALDVYDVHPLETSHALLRCPNLLLTPHIAAITATSFRAMSLGAATEMLRILAGKDPENLVNPKYRQYRTYL